jgi:hypothetical protein
VAYYGGNRLIWLYDIQLLSKVLSPSQRNEFAELAEAKGLQETCLEGIERIRASFHTVVPEAMWRACPSGTVEAAARYLNGSASYRLYADFLAVEGVRNKFKFLAELLLPPASYMRQKYPQSNPSWLPWLYLHRAGSGFLKRFRKNNLTTNDDVD